MAIVAMGPTIPVCAVRAGPTRSMAIITSRTGTAVHSTAFNTDSHTTCGATSRATETGRSTRNCAMQHRHATLVASPTRRSEPMRCTIWPL
jgi:hypothetical protein